MAVYLVTGKLGSGKSLCTVGKMRDYLNENRAVATNLDLKPEFLTNPWAKKTRLYRLPDKPQLEDLQLLPRPYEGPYDENKTGIIVLDECGTWLNTRNYRDKDRNKVIDYLLHIRKMGWDVMFIVQNAKMIDSQVREGLGEHVVYCSRFDRLRIPYLSGLLKNCLGINLKPPKVHLGLVKYGTEHNAPIAERWVYRGTELYNGYETEQIFGANDCAIHSVLPPYYTYGRFISRSQHERRNLAITCTKIGNTLNGSARVFFLLGLIIGWIFLASDDEAIPKAQANEAQEETVKHEKPAQESEEKYNPLAGLYISGSVKTSYGFDYVIYNQYGEHISPSGLGLTLRGIDFCKAVIISDNAKLDVNCSKPATDDKPTKKPTSEEYIQELAINS